jgi:pilus assembly protein Flp/PilA
MLEVIRRMWTDDDGQDIAEYAILLAVIALVAIAGATAIGTNANALFQSVKDKLVAPATGTGTGTP